MNIYRNGHFRKLKGPFLDLFKIGDIYINELFHIQCLTINEQVGICNLVLNSDLGDY